MSTDATTCEAFTCRRPVEPLTDDNAMLVWIIDRTRPLLDATVSSPGVSEQVNRIHRACFNEREYQRA